MFFRHTLIALALAAAVPVTVEASTLSLFAEAGGSVDVDFNTACGGSDNFDCEYAVGEGRVGNQQNNGDQELQIFDRLSGSTTVASQGQAPNTTADAFGASSAFTFSYAPTASNRLSFTFLGRTIIHNVDLSQVPMSSDNPDALAQSIVIRVRRTSLTDLVLDSNLGSGISIADQPEIAQAGGADVGYLYIGGFDLAQAWELSGVAELTLQRDNGRLWTGSGSAFQLKVTDLEVTAVPLPAGVWLLLAGLGGFAALRYRQNAA